VLTMAARDVGFYDDRGACGAQRGGRKLQDVGVQIDTNM